MKRVDLDYDYFPYYLETDHEVFFFRSLSNLRINDKNVLLTDDEGKEVFSGTNVKFKIGKVVKNK